MRVLIVCQYFHPENFRVNELALELERRGHTVVVLTGQPNYPKGDYYPGYETKTWRSRYEKFGDDIDVIRVPIVRRGQNSRFRLALNYLSFVPAAWWVSRRLPVAPDVVLVYQLSPIFMALPAHAVKRRTSAPVVHWIFDLWPESLEDLGTSNRIALSVVDKVVRRIYRNADRILVQSEGFLGSVRLRNSTNVPVDTLNNWGEAIFLQVPASTPAREGEQFRIVYAGNFGDAQGLEIVVEAAALTGSHIHWVLVGEGRRKQHIAELVALRGLERKVSVCPGQPLSEMPELYKSADALYVGLRTDASIGVTIPGKVQTYLAAGRPILASLAGPGADILADAEAGLIVEPGRADLLAAAAEALAEASHKSRVAMGARARAVFVSDFSRTATIDRLERILQDEVVRSRPHSS